MHPKPAGAAIANANNAVTMILAKGRTAMDSARLAAARRTVRCDQNSLDFTALSGDRGLGRAWCKRLIPLREPRLSHLQN